MPLMPTGLLFAAVSSGRMKKRRVGIGPFSRACLAAELKRSSGAYGRVSPDKAGKRKQSGINESGRE